MSKTMFNKRRSSWRIKDNNNKQEQCWPSKCSSLSLFFTCFIFTVGSTWCRLNLAWVSIDFLSLCSPGGCLAQEISDTHSRAGALYSFSASLVCSSLSYHKSIFFSPIFSRAAIFRRCPLSSGLTAIDLVQCDFPLGAAGWTQIRSYLKREYALSVHI